jgi:hypothetical protein
MFNSLRVGAVLPNLPGSPGVPSLRDAAGSHTRRERAIVWLTQLETEQKKVAVAAQDKIEQLKKLGK